MVLDRGAIEAKGTRDNAWVTADGPQVTWRQLPQHVAQVREDIDAQVLASGREAVDYCRGLAAAIAADEQQVAAAGPDQKQRQVESE